MELFIKFGAFLLAAGQFFYYGRHIGYYKGVERTNNIFAKAFKFNK